MLALYRCGRQADALDVYQRVRAALAQELGLEPGPALKALQVEILEQASVTRRARRSGPPKSSRNAASERARAPMPTRLRPYGPSCFAGRERELAALRTRWPRLRTLGQAGGVRDRRGRDRQDANRQRVCARGARRRRARARWTLRRRAQPPVPAVCRGPRAPRRPRSGGAARAPHRRVRRVRWRGWCRSCRRAPDAHRRAEDAQRVRAIRAVSRDRGLPGRGRATPGRCCSVLEDLHWADLPTLTLLRRILTSPREWPLMVVSTSRVDGLEDGHPLRELLADLHREPNVLRVNLAGLGSDDVVELLRGIPDAPQGGVDDQLAATLEAGTNGNPFFIIELVRSLSESGALEIDEGRLRLPDGVDLAEHLPASITETLGQRLRRMDDDLRRLLGVGGRGRRRVRPRSGRGGRGSSPPRRSGDSGGRRRRADRGSRRTRAVSLCQCADAALPVSRAGSRRADRAAPAGGRRDGGPSRIGRGSHRRARTALARGGRRRARDRVCAIRSWRATRRSRSSLPTRRGRWYEASLDLLGRFPGERETRALRAADQARRGRAPGGGSAVPRDAAGGGRRSRSGIGDEDMLVRAALANNARNAERDRHRRRGAHGHAGLRAARSSATKTAPERARLLAMQAAELMYSRGVGAPRPAQRRSALDRATAR